MKASCSGSTGSGSRHIAPQSGHANEPPTARAVRAQQASGEGRQAAVEENRGGLPATRKQLNYLEALVSDVVEDGITRFEEMVGKPIGELTREEASEWIGRLSGRAA